MPQENNHLKRNYSLSDRYIYNSILSLGTLERFRSFPVHRRRLHPPLPTSNIVLNSIHPLNYATMCQHCFGSKTALKIEQRFLNAKWFITGYSSVKCPQDFCFFCFVAVHTPKLICKNTHGKCYVCKQLSKHIFTFNTLTLKCLQASRKSC